MSECTGLRSSSVKNNKDLFFNLLTLVFQKEFDSCEEGLKPEQKST